MIDDFLPPKRTKKAGGSPAAVLSEPLETAPDAGSSLPAPESPQEPVPAQKSDAPTARTPRFWHNKKYLLITGGAVVLLACGGTAFTLTHKPAPRKTAAISAAKKAKAEPPKPVVITSPLTGAVVTAEQAKRPVTAIMIENSPDARPQSGLRDAGVIFEAIAEGGITRFMTLFQESRPQYIGPVRSIRPYYLDWLKPFDAPIAHVGGSLDALQAVRSPDGGFKDLDQFFNSSGYARIPQRYAPHNVYTSFDKLDALNASKGFTSSTFTPWARKAEQPAAAPTAKSIDITMSGFYYNVHYAYDGATNTYLRSEATKPHVDTVSAADPAPLQLHPKVVITLVMSYNYGPGSDGARSTYGTAGSGKLLLFQDGVAVEGTWSKADRSSPLLFLDAAAKPLKLNAGQTWISVVSSAGATTFTP